MRQAPEAFRTQRLVLRRPRLSDAEAVFAYASNPQAVHYMDYGPRATVEEVAAALADKPRQWESENFSWVVTIKPHDIAIGSIACWLEESAAGFGYVFNPTVWGQGYATEAARTVVEWAIHQPEIYRVWATCDTENVASGKVLEKCGLVCEGRLRCYQVRPNISAIPRDSFMYARVSSPI